MSQKKLIHSRNIFITIFFACYSAAQLIMSPLYSFSIVSILHMLAAIFCISIYFIQKRTFQPLILQAIILITFNLYIFSMCWVLPEISHMLFLVFPIILSAIYNSFKLIITITLFTCAEVALVYNTFGGQLQTNSEENLFIHFIFFLFMIAVLILLYTIKLRKEWSDIFSENKRMNTILTSKESYLELFFKHAEDAIAVFSLDEKIIAINPAFEKLYGWSRQESIGQQIRLYHPTDEEAVLYRTRKVLQGVSFHSVRTRELRKDGSQFEAEITLTPFYDSHNVIIGVSLLTRDITLRLQADNLKMDTEKLAAISQIAASVAHEVRNPMTAISGFIQMMNQDPNNPYLSYTEIMYDEIKRIDVIIGEFLLLSKPNVKEIDTLFIEDIITDTIKMFEPKLSNLSVVTVANFPENKAVINGNKGSLKQVFVNLYKNSLEAIEQDGVISVTVTHSKKNVSITLLDNGIGMDEDVVKNIFEPFYTTKLDGTGLGMMITKKIILDHEGTISIASTKNKGTETTITLPFVQIVEPPLL